MLRLVARGFTDAQIAEQLVISPRIVKTHLPSTYGKMQASSRSAATRLSINTSDSYANAPVQPRDCNTSFTRFCLVSLNKSKRSWKNSARTGENDTSPKREWRVLRKVVGVSTNHRFSRQVKPRAVLCCFGKERILTLSITSGQCIGCDGTHYDVAPDCSIGLLGKRKVVCLKISNVLL